MLGFIEFSLVDQSISDSCEISPVPYVKKMTTNSKYHALKKRRCKKTIEGRRSLAEKSQQNNCYRAGPRAGHDDWTRNLDRVNLKWPFGNYKSLKSIQNVKEFK